MEFGVGKGRGREREDGRPLRWDEGRKGQRSEVGGQRSEAIRVKAPRLNKCKKGLTGQAGQAKLKAEG